MEADAATAAQPKARRRWHQFTLRTLLFGVTLAGCGFGWFGWKVREARQQEAAVAAIQKLGGFVEYDYQRVDGFDLPDAKPPGPAWLHAWLGADFFGDVEEVHFFLGPALKDADLEPIKRLRQLKQLDLVGTPVSEAGMASLRSALSNCQINR